MTSSRSLRRRAVWAVPALTLGAIGAATLLPTAASASAHPVLPTRTPAQLLAAVQGSAVTHLSGEIVETARLGLPELPGAGNTAALSWQTLVTGTHTARVWVNGPDQQRVALLGQLAESDVVRNGRDVWTYSSATGKASHMTLPATATGKADAADPQDEAHSPAELTPQAAADQALAAITPTTAVSVDPTARVAGQKAYTLVLTPRQSGSTVRKVLIAVDAVHNVPLRVQVFGAATRPAFETAFANISYAKPAAKVFRFTPPRGSTTAAPPKAAEPKTSAPEPAGHPAADAKPTVLGSGWTSVAVFPASASPLAAAAKAGSGDRADETASTLARLTKHQPDGSSLLSTALVNVLIAKDGRVIVGAVTPAVLERAAAGKLR